MATKKNSSKRRSKTSSATKKTIQEKQQAFRDEIFLWIIVAVSLLLFISNFGIGGVVGNAISSFFFGVFGLLAYVFPILLCVGSFFVISNRKNGIAILKFIASVIFVCFLDMFLALVVNGSDGLSPIDAFRQSFQNKSGGGLVGGALSSLFVPAFGLIGSYIIAVVILIISLVLITERSLMGGMKKGGKHIYDSVKENNERYQDYCEKREEERANRRNRRMEKKVSGVSPDTKIEKPVKQEDSDEINEIFSKEETRVKLFSTNEKEPVFPPDPLKANPPLTGVASSLEELLPEQSKEVSEPVISGVFEETPVILESEQDHNAEPKKPTPKEVQKELEEVTSAVSEIKEIKDYQFPPVNLLKKAAPQKSSNTKVSLQETANLLQQTLKNFGVQVTITNISCGPSVTRYELQPEMGVKVSKIVNLADDIKLNLAASDIRIEAPIPGKAAVGIEVPNKENIMVSFRELIESEEFASSKSNVSFAVGKDIGGKIKVADIAKMPHLLIAGATGSGKSVCINTIIMSILYKANPSDVKLIMIDPKVVELSVYNGIPHLLIPVVTDPKKAAGALQWAVNEMTERYEKFAQFGVRDINGYNQKVKNWKEDDTIQPLSKMPQIVVIVDELADLMMVASSEVEESICRLAQLARAAGIHLVIATQRPSVNVITGLIKANMPSRIAFAVTSGVDSRTILDMNGAEKLLGKGDMLFNPQGIPKPIRVQGAFVSDEEVAAVVDFLKDKNQVTYDEDVQSKVESLKDSANASVSISGGDTADDGRDSYFVEAAKILMDKDRASIGMLQRYLKVGFNRAARIMDQLEEAGIVGPEEGTKPRKVIMTPEQFQEFIDESL